MQAYNAQLYIRRLVLWAVTLAALLGLLAGISVPVRGDEFTVGHTGADVAAQLYGLSGQGIGVAVLDSGVAHRPDLKMVSLLKSRVVKDVNFVPDTTATYDFCGHGTHVAGIVAGNGFDSVGIRYYRSFFGIARKANVINVRVLNRTGQGIVSQVIAGIQWVVDNKSTYNIRVMNLSLGHVAGESYKTDPLCQAVEAAWKAGIVVVCSAGNNGRLNSDQNMDLDNEGWGTAYGTIQSPGNDPYVITVGAMKETDGNRSVDRIATYSSRGPSRLDFVMKPDIVAPGNKVISLTSWNSYLADTYGDTNRVPYSAYCIRNLPGNSRDYFQLSGTSMSAPVVSGAAALILQKYPSLSPDTVKARLMISADKWELADGRIDPFTFGAGYLNIPAALKCNAVATMPALSPQVYLDADNNVCVDIQKILWGTSSIWGLTTADPHGTTPPPDARIIWGTGLAMSDPTNPDAPPVTKIIWGTGILGNCAIWYDMTVWTTGCGSVDLTTTAIKGE